MDINCLIEYTSCDNIINIRTRYPHLEELFHGLKSRVLSIVNEYGLSAFYSFYFLEMMTMLEWKCFEEGSYRSIGKRKLVYIPYEIWKTKHINRHNHCSFEMHKDYFYEDQQLLNYIKEKFSEELYVQNHLQQSFSITNISLVKTVQNIRGFKKRSYYNAGKLFEFI
jgi:hypothetical protein